MSCTLVLLDCNSRGFDLRVSSLEFVSMVSLLNTLLCYSNSVLLFLEFVSIDSSSSSFFMRKDLEFLCKIK